MGYPLFQSALSSTPFSGTMADTSTPTPADGSQQQQAPYVSPEQSHADLLAKEEADARQRQVTLQALGQQKQERLAEIARVKNLQWVGRPTSKLARRQRTFLNGNDPRNLEPPEMMYQRLKILEQMHGDVQKIDDQIRMASQLSPYEEALRRNSGEEQAKTEYTQREIDYLNNVVNPALQKIGKPPLDPDTIYEMARNRTASPKGRYGEVDPIKQLTDAARYGDTVDKSGIALAPEGPLRLAAAAGHAQGERVRTEKATSKTEKPPSLSAIYNIAARELDDVLRSLPPSGIRKVMGKDILGQPDPTATPIDVPYHNAEDLKKARAEVARRMPFVVERIPGYVDAGGSALPGAQALEDAKAQEDSAKAGGQGQKGVTFEEKLAAAKAKIAARKAK